jgi:putative Mg2+ transporter-C (MgtC) family protein
MDLMPITLHWSDIGIRLGLAILAGSLIGLNRGESGKAAGLRTTLLVCLAACLAMLQVNALLAQAGKASASFAVLDLMRLPLGILSGVGFIGAGAILRKDGLVVGLTTAATLWFVTVVGLCIGGGQLALGGIGLLLGLIVLWGLKRVEQTLPRERSVILTVEYDQTSALRGDLMRRLKAEGCEVRPHSFSAKTHEKTCTECFDVTWPRAKPLRSAGRSRNKRQYGDIAIPARSTYSSGASGFFTLPFCRTVPATPRGQRNNARKRRWRVTGRAGAASSAAAGVAGPN